MLPKIQIFDCLYAIIASKIIVLLYILVSVIVQNKKKIKCTEERNGWFFDYIGSTEYNQVVRNETISFFFNTLHNGMHVTVY